MIRLGSRITLTTVALALIFAGALGNVHDRIAYGSVIDFIEVHIYTYHWPDFNLADSSIVTGACLLMLDSLLPKAGVRDQGSGIRKRPPEGGGFACRWSWFRQLHSIGGMPHLYGSRFS